MAFERDKLRETVIGLAERKLSEEGLDALRARTVAVEAEVSVGTIYNLFGSMNGLLEEVFSRATLRFQKEARDHLAALRTEDRRALLVGLAEAYLDFVTRNETVWSAFLAYNRSREDRENDPYLARQGPLFDLVGDVLRGTVMDRGDDSRREAARMLWSSVHGIVTLNYLGMASPEAEAATRKQMGMLVDLVLAGMGERELTLAAA